MVVSSGASPSKTAPKRVLVVDDDPDTGRCVCELVSFLGHRTRLVTDGPRALAEWRDFEPDVVLLDLGLPGTSGHEVARALRAQAAGKPLLIVAMTGLGRAQDQARSFAAGMDVHLTKPFGLSALREVFERSVRAISPPRAGWAEGTSGWRFGRSSNDP